MALITNVTVADGDVATAALINARFAAHIAQINGNLDTTNIAANGVGTTQLGAGVVTPAKLEATPFTTYKGVASYPLLLSIGGLGAATYVPVGNGVSLISSVTGAPPALLIRAADHAITGKTTNMRLGIDLFVNATALGAATVTFGLYPLTLVAGGAGGMTLTLGAAVGSSTVAMNSGWSSGPGSALSADFALPADNVYVVAFVITGTVPAAHFSSGTLRAYVKHV